MSSTDPFDDGTSEREPSGEGSGGSITFFAGFVGSIILAVFGVPAIWRFGAVAALAVGLVWWVMSASAEMRKKDISTGHIICSMTGAGLALASSPLGFGLLAAGWAFWTTVLASLPVFVAGAFIFIVCTKDEQ